MTTPSPTSPRLAFILLADQQTKHLARLMRRLNKTGWPIYLHLDRRMKEIPYAEAVVEASRLPNVDLLRRYRCHPGGGGTLRATLRGMDTALAAPVPFDHLFVISGQSYPIKTDQELAALSSANQGISWIEMYSLPSEHAWQAEKGGMDRFERRHFNDVPLGIARKWMGQISRRGWTPAGPVPADLPLFGGSHFWGLSREAALYIADYRQRRPDVMRFFRHVASPEEHFIQTVLAGSPLATEGKVRNQIPHYLPCDKATSHSTTLTLEHLPELLASERLFARVFDDKASVELRDALDERNKGNKTAKG